MHYLIRLLTMALPDVKNIQGDTFSKGFPKDFETFYFFTITDNQQSGKKFPSLLADVAKTQISTLDTILAEWTLIDGDKEFDKNRPENVGLKTSDKNFKSSDPRPFSDALIAFSMKGLKKVTAHKTLCSQPSKLSGTDSSYLRRHSAGTF